MFGSDARARMRAYSRGARRASALAFLGRSPARAAARHDTQHPPLLGSARLPPAPGDAPSDGLHVTVTSLPEENRSDSSRPAALGAAAAAALAPDSASFDGELGPPLIQLLSWFTREATSIKPAGLRYDMATKRPEIASGAARKPLNIACATIRRRASREFCGDDVKRVTRR